MNLRRFLIEGATLVIAAIILGLVANAIAGSERKVSLAASAMPERAVNAQQAAPPVPESSITEDREELPTEETPATLEEPAPVGTTTSTASPTVPAPQGQAATKVSREQILERFPSTPDIPAEEIHTADAKWLWDQGMVFLDARRTAIYNDGHIRNARSFPVWESSVDEKVKQLSTEGLSPDMPIVIYCSGGECEDSHLLAQKLWGMFFNNLRVYHEGFPGWKEAGYPIEKGSGS